MRQKHQQDALIFCEHQAHQVRAETLLLHQLLRLQEAFNTLFIHDTASLRIML